ncbi:MAG TPA: CoB--CoM heterodisulfide reductase iron-sulfur subunit B family protein [Bacteroidota bacterium]|nr:CoB--CoM heterodisulfide reductase iron-sulfur subunit B family protein [Bacteroidota bacterium]
MNYLYYPGCSLHSTGRAYEESMLAVFKALEIPLNELEDWNCCGATSYFSIDETEAFALAARNLELAENQSGNGSAQLVAPCAACYLVLTKTQHYLTNYPEIKNKVNEALKTVGMNYEGKTKVRHPLDILTNDYGIEKVAKHVKTPLKGVKVACYYGCQVVRPFALFDDPLYPTSMDRLVKALGAEAVDWPLKTRCCGGSLTGTIQEAGLRLSRALLLDAQKRKADVIVTCCPLCQHNLECYQGRINRKLNDRIDIPVMYFTQLIGLALGIPEKELGIGRLFVKPRFQRPELKKGEPAHA